MAALHANRRLRLNLFKICFKFTFFLNFIDDFDIGHFLATFISEYFKAFIMRFTRTRLKKHKNSQRRIIALKFRTREPAAKRSGPSHRVRISLDHEHLLRHLYSHKHRNEAGPSKSVAWWDVAYRAFRGASREASNSVPGNRGVPRKVTGKGVGRCSPFSRVIENKSVASMWHHQRTKKKKKRRIRRKRQRSQDSQALRDFLIKE